MSDHTVNLFANSVETEYRSEKLGDVRRYFLPIRPMGGSESKLGQYARFAAMLGASVSMLLLIFGVLPMLFSIASLIGQALQPPGNNAAGVDNFVGAAEILFGFPAAAFAFYTVKFTLLAVAIYQGKTRCEVLVGRKHVVHRELFFGFSFKFRQPTEDVENVYLNPLIASDARKFVEGKEAYEFLLRLVPDGLYAIGFKRRNSVPVAFGYALEVLNPLAKDIRRDLVRENVSGRDEFEVINSTTYLRNEEDLIADSQDAGPDSDQWEALADDGFQIELPEESLIEVVQQDKVVVYRMPKSGFWGVGKASWIVVAALVVLFFVSMLVFLQGKPIDVETVTVMGGFFSAALAATVVICYLGSREAMLGVDGGLLFIEEKSIFGARWTEFTESQLDRIAVENSNVSVNEVPIKHLLIHPKNGKAKGRFSQLNNQELFWLAQQLNQRLALNDTSDEKLNSLFDQNGAIRELGPTRLIVDTQSFAVEITVPRLGCWQLVVRLLTPTVIALVVIACFIFAISQKEFFLAFLAGAMAIGTIGIAIAMLAYLTRSFHVIVEPTELIVRRAGFLSRKTFRLSRSAFKAVRIQGSGTIVNGKKLHNLAFDSDEKQAVFKMMLGWSIPELKHVAALITKSLSENSPSV